MNLSPSGVGAIPHSKQSYLLSSLFPFFLGKLQKGSHPSRSIPHSQIDVASRRARWTTVLVWPRASILDKWRSRGIPFSFAAELSPPRSDPSPFPRDSMRSSSLLRDALLRVVLAVLRRWKSLFREKSFFRGDHLLVRESLLCANFPYGGREVSSDRAVSP